MKYLIVLLFLVNLNCLADTGLAAYPLLSPKYPCDDFLETFTDAPIKRTVFLDGTFGNDKTCLKRFLKLPGKKLVEIHISNESGRRRFQLGVNDFLPNLTPIEYNRYWELKLPIVVRPFERKVRSWQNFVKTYPKVTWLMSEGLESNGSILAAVNRINTIKKYWKGKTVYNSNYSGRTSFAGANFREVHATGIYTPNSRTILNFDGEGICWFCTAAPFANPFYYPWKWLGLNILEPADKVHSLVFLWDLESQNSTTDGSYQVIQDITYKIVEMLKKNSLINQFN